MPPLPRPLRCGVLLLCAALLACARVPEAEPEAPLRPGVPTPAERRVERVLVIALDGASWRILAPLAHNGRVPHLTRLAQNGVFSRLRTLEPTVSPAIWTTIATGVLPPQHGILGFDGVPGKNMKTLPNAGMRRIKAWWEVLDDAGLSSGTIGWWATWPADRLRAGSYLVSDRVPYTRFEAVLHHDALDARDTEPAALLDEVLPLVERPNEIDRAEVARFLNLTDTEIDALLAADYTMGSFLPEFKFVYQSDRSTWKMAMHLLAERPVDVATVYLTGIDTVSHLYWHFAFPKQFPRVKIDPEDVRRFGQVIERYYELVDRYVGEMLRVVGEDTTVLVVSDHGFGGTGRVPWSGGHGRITLGAPIAPPGVLILSGPGIATGGKGVDASVLDIAPTLLALLGLPAGADMPGRVLEEAFAPGAAVTPARIASWEQIGRRRVTQAPPVDPEGDSERLERLRALGYIE
jgi:arylsulfatase A-like enzyme